MLHAYVHNTGDTTVLHGALPLAEVSVFNYFETRSKYLLQKELRWWAENRSVLVKSPNDPTRTHLAYHYNVQADGPRPEVCTKRFPIYILS